MAGRSNDSTEMLGDLIRLLDAAYDLRRQIDSWARDSYGLPLTQLMTVLALAQVGGKANVTQIARAVGRRSHTVTVVIDVLEQKGFVTRNRSTDGDRRVVVIQLTPKGIALAAPRRGDEQMPEMPLSNDERQDVHRVVDLLERLASAAS